MPKGFLVGIAFFMSQSEVTRAVYNSTSSQISLDRSRSSLKQLPTSPSNQQTLLGGHVELRSGESSIELRVLADRSVAELFAQKGRTTMSGRAYPTQDSSTSAALVVEGDRQTMQPQIDFDVWEMGSCRARTMS